jgi:hypothetical protein
MEVSHLIVIQKLHERPLFVERRQGDVNPSSDCLYITVATRREEICNCKVRSL